MSSFESNDGARDMNSTEEAAGGFVTARGNATVLLEPSEEVLNQMASFVHVPS